MDSNKQQSDLKNLIYQYVEVLKQHKSPGLHSIDLLPAPKKELKQAIISLIRSEADPEPKEVLKQSYLRLSSFQPQEIIDVHLASQLHKYVGRPEELMKQAQEALWDRWHQYEEMAKKEA